MRYLIDTHLLLWASGPVERLSKAARRVLDEPEHDLFVSAASLWEIAVKHALGRSDFQVDPALFRSNLRNQRVEELDVTGDHALAVGTLPPLHRDPFDRILIAQAMVEGLTLLTADSNIARYPGPIFKV